MGIQKLTKFEIFANVPRITQPRRHILKQLAVVNIQLSNFLVGFQRKSAIKGEEDVLDNTQCVP